MSDLNFTAFASPARDVPQAFPERLATAASAAAYCGVDVEDLIGYAESGHAPHYTVNGKGPYFRKTEIREWVRENLIRRHVGFPIPKQIDVVQAVTAVGALAPPPRLAMIESLCYLPLIGHVPGIYFLCKGDEVVYVGQTVSIAARVSQHMRESAKDFDHDRVFFLPCPKANLDETERHYIRLLKPRLNSKLMTTVVDYRPVFRCPEGDV